MAYYRDLMDDEPSFTEDPRGAKSKFNVWLNCSSSFDDDDIGFTHFDREREELEDQRRW